LISGSERQTFGSGFDCKGIDMDEPKSKPESKPAPDGNARAAALRAEIDKLTGGKKADVSGQGADKSPSNPREYIDKWMAEHDKKPET
jgi:hypothetical protein